MIDFVIAKYLRLSSEDDDLKQAGKAESNSIANQRNLLDSYIRRSSEFSDATVLEFCDDGWSGKNFERPAVQEMLEQVRQGKINCVIVKDLSRFGRDYITVGNYISRIFPFLNVRFISINDGFDSIHTQDIDSLDTSFKALLYDLYSRDLSRKVRTAKNSRAERGAFLSPFAPYGYVKDPHDKNRLVIDPDAAAIVHAIFTMMGKGMTTLEIARELNSKSVPTPMLYKRESGCSRAVWPSVNKENFWTHHSIVRILRDERYIGTNVYGKRRRDIVGNTHTVKVSKKEWIAKENMHDGIISREVFNLAQQNLRAYEEHECGELDKSRITVRCGICGHVMERTHAKNVSFVCRTAYVTDAYSCPTETVYESDIMDVLKKSLQTQASYAVNLSATWEEQQRKWKKEAKTLLQSIEETSELLRQYDLRIKEMYEAYIAGKISMAEYVSTKAAAAREKDTLVKQLSIQKAQFHSVSENGSVNNRYITVFRKYTDVKELTDEILTEVLEEVVVYPDWRLEIKWKLRQEFDDLIIALYGDKKYAKQESMVVLQNRPA